MSDVAIIGEKDLISALGALGIARYYAKTPAQARDAFLQAEKDKVKIVLVFERLAKPLVELMKKKAEPALVLIPDHRGAAGLADDLIRKAMAKAIGTEEIRI